jgi:hypothetical protein
MRWNENIVRISEAERNAAKARLLFEIVPAQSWYERGFPRPMSTGTSRSLTHMNFA